MPSLSQQARWRRQFAPFKARVQEAKEHGAEAMAHSTVDIADTELDPQTARNRIESRRWLAGVTKPKEYGPRVDLNVTTQVDYTAAHADARARLRLMRDLPPTLVSQVIDGATVYAPSTTDSQSDAAPSEHSTEPAHDIFE